ncbi:MAG: hypothetical protein JXA10_17070, partial [Anaerolineae bacterium]|nr:hypothetical protein [Anaerolineae bacterium]
MEGAILFMMALGGLGAFGVGVVLLVMYWRSGRRSIGEPIVYGNLVQCPRCEYMNPLDSAACLNCQLPLSHQRRAYQPPPSPTYPTLPPQYAQRPAPPPNVPAQYAAPPNQDATVAQVRTPVMPKPPSPQSYDPSYAPPTVRRAAPQPAPPPAPQSITPSPAKSPPPAAARMLPLQHQPPPATP